MPGLWIFLILLAAFYAYGRFGGLSEQADGLLSENGIFAIGEDASGVVEAEAAGADGAEDPPGSVLPEEVPAVGSEIQDIDPDGKSEQTDGSGNGSDTGEGDTAGDDAGAYGISAETAPQLPGQAEEVLFSELRLLPSLAEIPLYDGQAWADINGDVPFFQAETTEPFEYYGDLDRLGRCTVVYACVGPETMPTEERESISEVHPSGWHSTDYEEIDGGKLYNRCHLIGYQLTGQNANEKNLITGTRYMNVEGMLPFENSVASYIRTTGHHVMYRVTPLFDGDNLVTAGVLMEARSVEDPLVQYCAFCYNVQPGIVIDYASGESRRESRDTRMLPQTGDDSAGDAAVPDGEVLISEYGDVRAQDSTGEGGNAEGADYVLNTSTKKFHYPDCSSVSQMKEKNKQYFRGSRDEVIAMGYDPCGNCHP